MQGVIAINLAAVIFGTAALYGKLNVSVFWIVAFRAGFGAVTLALFGGSKTLHSLFAARPYLWPFAVSGFLLALHWLTFFASVQLAGVAVATLTFATFPLFTVLVEAAYARRLPRLVELAAGLAILIAVALLVDPASGASHLLGAGAGLLSALTYAFFWRVSHRLEHLPPKTVALCQNAVVTLLLLPLLPFATPVPTQAFEWLSLVAVGVVNTALMLLLYLYALKRISPSTCSGFIALEPVYAIAFAAVLFHEPLTPWIAVSIALILGASFALLRLEKETSPHVL